MNCMQLCRLFHTVRYLRCEQIWFRLYYRVVRLKLDEKAAGDISCSNFVWKGCSYGNQCFFEDDKVRFLGEWGTISSSEDWNSSTKSKLWLYNAHYFDDLNVLSGDERKNYQLKLMHRWIEENPPLYGNGWEPYPLSLRIVNWIKWLSRQNEKDVRLLVSLQFQADALLKQLEYHILGNHLFVNAKALVFAGVFLNCSRSEIYLKKGLEILSREVSEQFLDDGGHFERSPMYHETLLWDLLDLIYLSKVSSSAVLEKHQANWLAVAAKARRWLEIMSHPDGEITFFNDAAIGVAASPKVIEAYSDLCDVAVLPSSIGAGVETLPVSGYSRITMPDHTTYFDHAPVGPDYLPGHAHADTLSVEWSVADQRVLVNSGTSLYGASNERLRQRKTAAHNTVVIENEDSSEVWGGFRVARRARATLEKVNEVNQAVELVASHNGYTRLVGKPVHRRKLVSSPVSLEVTDYVEGSFSSAYASYHLHPDIKVVPLEDTSVKLLLPCGRQVMVVSNQGLSVEDATWHPQFGSSLPNKKILAEIGSTPLVILFTLQ